MRSETKIIVRVLKTHEEIVEIYGVTRLEAEAEARRMEGVVAVLESGYPEDMPNAVAVRPAVAGTHQPFVGNSGLENRQ
jgi:hypothetical protein